MKRIEILDTSLRDGMQGHNIDYSLNDKIQIVALLRSLGINYIEAGNPYSNITDGELFNCIKGDDLVAFGSTRRKDNYCENDASLAALSYCKATKIGIFGKCWKLHVKNVLSASLEENLEMISSSIKFLIKSGKTVIFDAEHFYDGYADDATYAIQVLRVAFDAGAKTLVLCDTNGNTFTSDFYRITKEIVNLFKNATIGVHCHNDSGLAVANTMAGVNAGATHIQGTLLGTGERCGNACLSTIIPNLQLKLGFEIIPAENLSKLTACCKSLAEITNIALNPDLPYVGENAFTHKAGMHIDGIIKEGKTFEHIPPEAVGNDRKLVLSQLSGKSIITEKLKRLFPNKAFSEIMLQNILNKLKSEEADGYSYEASDASFYILTKSVCEETSNHFNLLSYKVINEENGSNSAIVKIEVKGKTTLSGSEGVGPVDALDKAIRSALSNFYPCLNDVSLIDYKVRVLDSKSATGAKVRVLITSTNGIFNWTTIGVSPDIIKASFIALSDSLNYYLDLQKL